ncbi:unnamed protein product, partial [Porites evermanni]
VLEPSTETTSTTEADEAAFYFSSQSARPIERPAGNGIYIKVIETGIQTEEVEEPGLTEGIDKKAIETGIPRTEEVKEAGLKQTATGETRQIEKPTDPVPLTSLTVNVSELLWCFRVVSLGC